MKEVPTIKLITEAYPNGELEIARLSGRGAISQLFSYELLVAARDPEGVDGEELVGADATLVYEVAGVEIRRIHGMISTLNDRLDVEAPRASYELGFVPRAYRMALVETLDVFLDLSVPDVIRQKLGEAAMRERPAPGPDGRRRDDEGYDFEMRLQDPYPVREFVVQYKETDLAFVSRLCEHIGVSFFFEHVGGRDVMVFTDQNGGYRPIDGDHAIPFRPRGEHRDVFRFEEKIRMIPARYVVRDYNYRTPQVTLTGQANVANGTGSVVEYGSHVKTPKEAEHLAHVRAQEQLASRRVFHGSSDVPTLRAGSLFTLTGHPRNDLDLLVVEVTERATQVVAGVAKIDGPAYSNELTAIPQSRRYRPPRVTPKPRIHGVVTGVIDAADKGKYAELDDQGRYRVKFMFDTTGPGEGQASRLVRMAQPHAGEGYGMHFPLRPGVEVILTFVDGDPDRPIIAATVPNPQTVSPVSSGNAPRNIIRTGGGNEINIDDTDDEHRIKLSTPHKNTTFQLGAPNSPEGGAMLETTGASSTVAMAGMGSFSAITSSIAAIGDLVEGGNITSVAQRPGFAAIATTVKELMASILEIASATLEAVLAAKEAHLATLKKESILDSVQAQKDWDAQKEKVEAVEKTKLAERAKMAEAGSAPYDDAEAALLAKRPAGMTADAYRQTDAYKTAEADLLKQPGMMNARAMRAYADHEPVAPPMTQELYDEAGKATDMAANEHDLLEKMKAYEEAQKAYEQKRIELMTNEEFLRDAKKGEIPGTYIGEVDYYSGEQKRLEAEMAEAKAARDAAKTSVDGEIPSGSSDPAYADYKTAVGDAADDSKANKSWNDAKESKRTYDEELEDIEYGDTAQGLKQAKIAVNLAKTATVLLFSTVIQAYTLVKWILARFKEKEEKLASLAAARLSLPIVNPPGAEFMKGDLVQNTLGSNGNTEVYAKKSLFVWGKIAWMMGKKRLVASAGEELDLLSKDKAEFAATNDIKITSDDVTIHADTHLKLEATPRIVPPPPGVPWTSPGKISALAKGQIKVASEKGTVFINADERNVQIKAPMRYFVGEAKEIQLDATEKAHLLADAWGLHVQSDAGGGGQILLGDDEWKLEIKKDFVDLGSAKDGLQVKPGKVLICEPKSSISLAAGAVDIKGKSLSLLGDEVKVAGGSLLVKGVAGPPGQRGQRGKRGKKGPPGDKPK